MAFIKRKFETIVWLTAVFILFQPGMVTGGFTLCFFQFLGFESCPGCGLGHSIYHALHLDFKESFNEHILGIPVSLALLTRIIIKFLPPNKTSQLI
jgi:hypothetical protein